MALFICATKLAAGTIDNRWPPAVCSGRSLMALFICATKLDPGTRHMVCRELRPSTMKQVLAARETVVIGSAA